MGSKRDAALKFGGAEYTAMSQIIVFLFITDFNKKKKKKSSVMQWRQNMFIGCSWKTKGRGNFKKQEGEPGTPNIRECVTRRRRKNDIIKKP